ncbi:hypothetical protein AB0I77_12450 [Streptomyces sp. NPDC050619]|uniref:hypothetical protein n=1 Tax=Streptomyces sp. NPDC050619 TaxID=3157214 RepID=UPI0034406AD5
MRAAWILNLAPVLRRADEIRITQVSLNFARSRSVFDRGARLGAGPVLRPRRKHLETHR